VVAAFVTVICVGSRTFYEVVLTRLRGRRAYSALPTKFETTMRKRVAWTLLAAWIWPLAVAAAEPLELKLSVDYADDDNVYRVPDNYGALGILLPPGASRTDQYRIAR
jgi:hypothetical protein